MIFECDKEARPLDNIYALTTYERIGRHKIKKSSDDYQYNKWRQSLPDDCFKCCRFDRCSPNRKCEHNPYNKSGE